MIEMRKTEPEIIDFSVMDRTELEKFAMDKSTRLVAVEAELETYKELLRKNRTNMFSGSSERYISEEQISLFNEAEVNADPDAKEPGKLDVLPVVKQKKKKGHKKELTAKLPKETIEYKLTDEERVCPKCGEELGEMNTIVRTEIEVIPAKYKAVEHRTQEYSCKNCDKKGTEGTIITAPSPKGLFRNSLASPSIVADIMWKKYGLAQPLYRQAQELLRIGLRLSRGTLANWVINAAFMYLKIIQDYMRSCLLDAGVIHADETPLTVLSEPGREASQKSYMWIYRTGECEEKKMILFNYSPGRGAEYPKAFLKGFKGYIHTDGYSAYRVLAKEDDTGSPDITIVGCWAHARRKFADIIKGLSKNESIKGSVTEKALDYIGALFKIEEEVKGVSADERYLYRKKHAKLLVDEYFAWLKSIKDQCAGSIGTAVTYSLNQEKDLRVYLDDGRLEISNNLGENAIRPFCVGRKNWLFADTPGGAEASSVCYGIIETAKANGIDAAKYIEHINYVYNSNLFETWKMWNGLGHIQNPKKTGEDRKTGGRFICLGSQSKVII